MKSSKYFSSKEIACRCGKCEAKEMEPEALHAADKLREAFGESLTVNSGRRCQDHNAAVGGATASQHLYGRALDFDWSSMSGEKRHKLLQLALSIFPVVGIHKQFLHCDTRPGPAKIFFY